MAAGYLAGERLEALGGNSRLLSPGIIRPGHPLGERALCNTGEVPLYAPLIRDDELGEIDCGRRVLAPHSTVVCVAHLVPDPHATTHLAWAWAWTEVGNELEAQDPLSYRVVARDIGPAVDRTG
jgi:hypothetical protein